MSIAEYVLFLTIFMLPWSFVIILLKEVRETSMKLKVAKRVNAALEQEHKRLRLQMSMPPERREG